MSLQLMLLRHAEASWQGVDDGEIEDFERPLSARGRYDATRMARQLALLPGARQAAVLSSPAVRAITTARRFAATLGVEGRAIRIDARLYEASAGDWVAALTAQPEVDTRLLAVGHNPGISELAGWLCPELAGWALPTSGIVALELEIPRWSEIAPGCGRHPRQLDPASSAP